LGLGRVLDLAVMVSTRKGVSGIANYPSGTVFTGLNPRRQSNTFVLLGLWTDRESLRASGVPLSAIPTAVELQESLLAAGNRSNLYDLCRLDAAFQRWPAAPLREG
jgi:hypothetical protein